MSATKLLRVFAATALVAAGALVLTAAPASADQQPQVVVEPNKPITKSYGPLTSQGTIQEQQRDPVPGDCAKAPGNGYCDAIPVKVDLPKDYDPNSDEFITHVVLTWDDQGSAAGQEEINDMDLFLYDSQFKQTGKSAGTTDPEKSAAADSRFTVLVLNSTGPNTGYTLKLTFSFKRFTPVTEKPFTFGNGSSDTTNPTTPSTPYTPTTSIMAPLDLPPLDLTDPDFSGGGGGSQLTNGVFTNAGRQALNEQGPAKPVGAGILIFSLVAVPLAGMGVGAFVFRRRASRLLEL